MRPRRGAVSPERLIIAAADRSSLCNMRTLTWLAGLTLRRTWHRLGVCSAVFFSLDIPAGYPQGPPEQIVESAHPAAVKAADPVNRQTPLEKAKQFLAEDMLEKALESLGVAEEADRFDPEVQFYLGEVWAKRTAFSKARQKFKIALRLDSESFTPSFRLAQMAVVLWERTREARFRSEAVGYLWRTKDLWNKAKTDRYTQDDVAAETLISQADTLLRRLLNISGEWLSPDGFVWKFSEKDGPLGKPTSKAKLPEGNIVIRQVNAPELQTTGSLWRATNLELQGWFTMTSLVDDHACNWNYKLAVKESPEGMKLTGTARLSGKQRKPCNMMSKEPWQIQLYRQ